MIGVIRFWDGARGKIATADRRWVSCDRDSFVNLLAVKTGVWVTFDIAETSRGLRATNVHLFGVAVPRLAAAREEGPP
jgi:hypothetical protein